MPKFDRLKSLEIESFGFSCPANQSITRLRLILDQAIHLYSLKIDYLTMLQLSSVQITNKSIRRLDLLANDGHFYGLECISLIQSLLGDQYEVLLIYVENSFIVLNLIDKLPNLRGLTFRSQENDDELIQ